MESFRIVGPKPRPDVVAAIAADCARLEERIQRPDRKRIEERANNIPMRPTGASP